MMLPTITLTGADARTPLDGLVALMISDTRVEIGLLYTDAPEDRPRYPSRLWLASALPALGGRAALHICGRTARRALLEAGLGDLVHCVSRIQVNGAITADEVERLCRMYPDHAVITQHCLANEDLFWSVRSPNHAVLTDSSGGRGISPRAWARPATLKAVGFAGGLGPDNMASEVPRILEVASESSWIDMENKLRTNDWFDLALARQALVQYQSATDHMGTHARKEHS